MACPLLSLDGRWTNWTWHDTQITDSKYYRISDITLISVILRLLLISYMKISDFSAGQNFFYSVVNFSENNPALKIGWPGPPTCIQKGMAEAHRLFNFWMRRCGGGVLWNVMEIYVIVEECVGRRLWSCGCMCMHVRTYVANDARITLRHTYINHNHNATKWFLLLL